MSMPQLRVDLQLCAKFVRDLVGEAMGFDCFQCDESAVDAGTMNAGKSSLSDLSLYAVHAPTGIMYLGRYIWQRHFRACCSKSYASEAKHDKNIKMIDLRSG